MAIGTGDKAPEFDLEEAADKPRVRLSDYIGRSNVLLVFHPFAFTAICAEEAMDLPYSFEAMSEAGSMLGSGSVIVADDSVSIPHMALRTARFYHHESCGKCTPCREGTNWTVKMLERVVRGEATPMDLDIISSVQQNIMGHCLCVLGDSMAMPVSAMVNKFRDEFEQVIAEAGMPIAVVQGAPETLGAAT